MRKSLIYVEVPAEFSGKLHVLTINRPKKRNALTREMVLEIISAIKEADSDPKVCAMIVTAAGNAAFCAGADLALIVEDEGGSHVSAFEELFLTMQSVGVPIICAANGAAVGGGLGILLASDLVVMSQNANICAPEINRGLFAMFISRFIYESFPEKIAHEILFAGRSLSAAELLSLHVVNRVVPESWVLENAFEFARVLCGLSGAVLRVGKKAIRAQKSLSFENAMRFLGEQLKINLALEDTQHGIDAFLKKQSPVWKNK